MFSKNLNFDRWTMLMTFEKPTAIALEHHTRLTTQRVI